MILSFRRQVIRLAMLSLMLAAAVPGSRAAAPIQNIGGRIKNFVAPSKDQAGRSVTAKGADARHVGNQIYELIKPVVTVREADDTLDMVIEAPECLFNGNSQMAYSTNQLSVKKGDGQFSITGKNWRWEPATAHLVIGSEVVALVQRSAVLTNTSSTAKPGMNVTNPPIRITSEQFDHEENLAKFMKNVRVVDLDRTLTCNLLQLAFEKEGGAKTIEAIDNVVIEQVGTQARGGKAVYQIAENILTLTNKPIWQFGERSGSSDLLLIDRTNQMVVARGSVYMKLPRTGLSETNRAAPPHPKKTPTTNDFVEIFADHFRFQEAKTTNDPGVAYYSGNVRVVQPQGQLLCRDLTIFFSPKENKLVRAIADGDVVVARADGKVVGDRAVYELSDEKITMTGNPKWQFGERGGSSRILIFYPETEELYALENVAMNMPVSGSSAGMDFSRGKKTAGTSAKAAGPGSETNVLHITAQTFSHRGDLSVFSGGVLVKDSRGELTAELLTILTGVSNQVQKISAERNVVIRQPDMMAVGKLAVYHATNGIVELTGDPVITAPDKRVKAEIFWINREQNTFSFGGNYQIEALGVAKGTNKPAAPFPLLPEKKPRRAKR